LFHKNNQNKFVAEGKKLATETLKRGSKFFEAQFMQNKLDGLHEHMELDCIKKHAQCKAKMELCKKICVCGATTACIVQSTSLYCATADVVCMVIVMINATTSIAIAITTMIVDWQTVFATNAPLATESMVVATISQTLGFKKNRSNGKVLLPYPLFPGQTGKAYMGRVL
jgi:hypothetical protein